MYSPQEVALIALFSCAFGMIIGYIVHNAVGAIDAERELMKKEQRPMAERRDSNASH